MATRQPTAMPMDVVQSVSDQLDQLALNFPFRSRADLMAMCQMDKLADQMARLSLEDLPEPMELDPQPTGSAPFALQG